jgi:uncharacterized protein (TIGR03437 family)
LVQEGQGAGGTRDLPAADASGGINLSATSGKVALVRDSSLLGGTSPSGPTVEDFVGYGAANFAEGSPAEMLGNTTAAARKSNGCVDSGNNATDFATQAPNPRNRSSALNPCLPVPISGPRISQGGVVNAASYLGGVVAPGEIVTIFGDSLGPANLAMLELTPDRRFVTNMLGGTRVLFGEIPAAMIYTSARQVSAVAPYGIAERRTTAVRVEYNGRMSDAVSFLVASTAPGIFTVDSSGQGQAAVLNQDGSVNGSFARAPPDSVITIFAAGGGRTHPATQDGAVVTGAPLLASETGVRIGGLTANVLYAGAAPFLVSGVVQINARVPSQTPPGARVALQVTIGNSASQSGITIAVGGDAPGVGPSEEKLENLRRETVPPPLPEVPHDRIGLPPDWLGLISWNIQVGGALGSLFSGTYQILAAQEIPSAASGDLLTSMLPGGSANWRMSLVDTADTMDNGFWFRNGVTVRDSFALFTSIESGRVAPDESVSLHPPQVAQFEAGDFDFTLINVHLTFADGDTRESARELRHILDYLDWYFREPEHDPDVVVCGDFNIPSRNSGQTGRAGVTLDAVIEEDGRFREGQRRFAVTVHQPSSRSSAAAGGLPANNYDHCVVSFDALEEFVQARRIDPSILTDHPDDPESRLTSDHFPVAAFFRTRGEGIALDRKTRIRP